jgi:hypothetical protein
MAYSVGTFSVGVLDEDETMLVSTASIALSGVALLTHVAAPNTVDVDESDRIVIDPTWPEIEIDLTVDVTLT